MDETSLVTLAALLVIFAALGWVLGIVGFFRAGRALAELAALRQRLAQPIEITPAAIEPAPLATAEPTAEAPSPEPPPLEPPPLEPIPTQPQPKPRRDLEAVLTTRWGVWLGAAALLMAGVFLIRYAVDQGLLGPAVRCTLATLLGAALVAAAEWLHRRPARLPGVADQAPPALAAGGVAVWFGAAYGAGVLYALLPPLAGFALMAVASLAGLALSLRHGRLVAAVGLVGAFVTPALVQTEAPSLPGLFLYLLFVTAAALTVVRITAWVWLGWATTIAGAAWALLSTVLGASPADIWAPALFLPAAAAVNLALLPEAALQHPIGRRLAWIPVAALGAVGLWLAIMQPEWATRAGVLLLAPLTIWRAAAEPRLDRLPWLAGLLFLLLLAAWPLPATPPPDLAVPPGSTTPGPVLALLWTAGLGAGLFAAAGLWFERRAARKLPWSALPAAVPVLALAIAYAQVEAFRPRPLWAAVALLLAAALTGTAAAALRDAGRERAGAHAAGAVAALALGFAMLLSDQWLTLAISLFLPALAWIEAKADLPPLRRVAVAVAAIVLSRLLANWYVLDYPWDGPPVLNTLLVGYGIPAASFAVASVMFRRRGDDLAVGVLEAGSVAFATVLVALEIRHLMHAGEIAAQDSSFLEAALHVASLAVLATVTMRIATRLDRPVLGWGWRVQGGLALAGGVILLFANPQFVPAPVGAAPLFDALLPAYALPAALAALALRHKATARPAVLRAALGGYAVVAGFAWITLEIRHLFHPDPMAEAPIDDAELWAWSGAWLVYGAVLMLAGIRGAAKPLRLAALAIIGLTAAKVFLIDMSGLVGLWRVLSFLGLGLVLIGLGAVYRRFVAAPSP
jgi:uncharacterized membrane protein